MLSMYENEADVAFDLDRQTTDRAMDRDDQMIKDSND